MTTPLAIEATGLVKRFGAKAALDGVDIERPHRHRHRGPRPQRRRQDHRGPHPHHPVRRHEPAPPRSPASTCATQANEVRRRIGLAAQDATIDPLLTGRENLVMIGELHQLARGEAKARAVELLEQFNLTDAAEQVTSGYSGGMRRRLDLAATLVARPQVLFLDEPTTGLDPRARNELWAVLDTLVGQGTTLLLTTQYLEEADRLADDILVVDHGKVIARGDARSLKRQVGGDNIGVTVRRPRRTSTARVELLRGCTDGDPVVDRPLRTITAPTSAGVAGLASVANALADAGLRVEDLSLRQPTLDEVFLTLTGVAIARRRRARGGSGMTAPTDTTRPVRRRHREHRRGRHAGGGPRAAPATRAWSTTCGWSPGGA